LFNGVAVVELIKSCVPDIKDPWSVSNVDLDPLLVAIRSATHGNMMEIETACPKCEEVSKFDVNLSAVLASFKPADYSVPLELGELRIKFKPMPYKVINEFSITQFGLQKSMSDIMNIEDEVKRDEASSEILKNILEITINVIASTIEHVKAPSVVVFEQDYIKEFLSNCDKQTFDKIKDYSTDLKRATQTKPLDIKCPECSHEFQQDFNINVSDFFA
jgi:phage FluMu protein Com